MLSKRHRTTTALALSASVCLAPGLWTADANRTSQWENALPGLNGGVTAIVARGDTLYVGGYFTAAEGVEANHVAMWDGHRWSALGSGMDRSVQALAIDQKGHLYAAGDFYQAGGRPAAHIARWDGEEWYALGPGLNSFVSALAVDERGALYAGGAFTRAGDVEVDYIARWDEGRWSPLGSGMDHNVFALAPGPGGELYAAGGFMTAGGEAANQVARWDGEQWHPLGSGTQPAFAGHPAMALAVDADGTVYLGGSFDAAGGLDSPNLARWDGRRWSRVGETVNGSVRALAIAEDGTLYAAGYFNRVGEIFAAHIAMWRNGRWMALERGTDALVEALAFDRHGMLHVGGMFQQAGATTAGRIACWMPSAVSTNAATQSVREAAIVSVHPNPVRARATITYTAPRSGNVFLAVYDLLGRERLTIAVGTRPSGSHEVTVNASNLVAGRYIIVIIADNSRVGSGHFVKE